MTFAMMMVMVMMGAHVCALNPVMNERADGRFNLSVVNERVHADGLLMNERVDGQLVDDHSDKSDRDGPVVPIPRACEPPHDKYPFCDPTIAMPERINDLISRLTLDEKPFLLIARESPKGNISRLGIPEYDWGGNCIHGVQSRCGYGEDGKERCPTSFPDPNFLGASFNKSAWLEMGKIIGVELRSLWLQGIGENHAPTQLPHIGLDCWSPNVGINRDPRWGRNMEVPSEDPLLNGYFGQMYSLGMQNGSDSRFLQGIATLKHFDANSLEGNWPGTNSACPGGTCTRHTIDVSISKYDLASTYLPAFKQSIMQGNAQAVMCSYNSINGKPSCANSWLLGTILRKSWGFKGMVTGDSGAVADIFDTHHYAADMPSACIEAISAGTDVQSAGWKKNQPWATGGGYIDYLPDAVRQGRLNESTLDDALRHAVGLRFRLGLFDPIQDQPYWHVSKDAVASSHNIAASHDATAQGLVLLKNEDEVLPLKVSKSTAVIGPLGDVRGTLIGNYMGQICPDNGDNVENYDCVQSLVEGIGNQSGAAVSFSPGLPSVLSNDTTGFASAMQAVKSADQIVLCLGIDGTVEGEGHDRHFIGLPYAQIQLAQAVLNNSRGKPVVVVLINGGQLAIDWLSAQAPAIVEAWYPGVFGARAVAEALYGVTNRWGKTPVTIYGENVLTEFNMTDFDMTKGSGRSYRYYSGKNVLYPMGYGLSYTRFSFKDSSIWTDPVALNPDDSMTFAVTVENIGNRKGDEVIMAFFSPLPGTIPSDEPASKLKRQLFAFERISLASGDKSVVSFVVSPDQLQLFSSAGDRTVYPGSYILKFTNGVDTAVTKNITLLTSDNQPLIREKFEVE